MNGDEERVFAVRKLLLRIIRQGGIGGQEVEIIETGFGTALGQVFSGDFNTWRGSNQSGLLPPASANSHNTWHLLPASQGTAG